MIDSIKLRIGNYIQFNDTVGVVKNINYSTIRAYVFNDIEDDLFNCEDIEPIPLTEEWLVKFGFNDLEESSIKRSILRQFLSEAVVSQETIDNQTKWIVYFVTKSGHKIQYVHQLQNLFHSLCGEELTIN